MSAVVEYWWIAIPLKIALWVWIAGMAREHSIKRERKERAAIRTMQAQGIDPHEQRKQEIIAQAQRRMAKQRK